MAALVAEPGLSWLQPAVPCQSHLPFPESHMAPVLSRPTVPCAPPKPPRKMMESAPCMANVLGAQYMQERAPLQGLCQPSEGHSTLQADLRAMSPA